jgi:hypothetical protein
MVARAHQRVDNRACTACARKRSTMHHKGYFVDAGTMMHGQVFPAHDALSHTLSQHPWLTQLAPSHVLSLPHRALLATAFGVTVGN